MGISGPVQQQGVCYYNNWQLLWFLKGPKVAIWEMVIEQEVAKEWLCGVQCPGLPCAELCSPTSALHAQRKPRHPTTLANSRPGSFSAPCKRRGWKPMSQQREEQQRTLRFGVNRSPCGLFPPRPRLQVARWKSRDAVREVFILIFLIMEEWQALEERYQQLEQATGSCPKLQAWKQAACHRHKGWARFPAWDKRELITGLLPFNENKQRFEIQHTKGPNISVPWPLALAKSNTTWIFCNKSWSAFSCIAWVEAGTSEGSESGWAASHLPGSDLPHPRPSEAVCHHTRLDVVIPRKTKASPVWHEQGISGR